MDEKDEKDEKGEIIIQPRLVSSSLVPNSIFNEYMAFYENVLVFKKREFSLKNKDFFDMVKNRINYIIKNNSYCKGCPEYDSDFSYDLTVLIYDSINLNKDGSYDLNVKNIHSFYEIRQEENLLNREPYLGTYNFCADINKQGKGTIKNILNGENYRNIYNYFSNLDIFKDIFKYNVGGILKNKKMWKGLLISNPLFKSLCNLYIKAGYVDSIEIKRTNPKGDTFPLLLSMWNDPDNIEKISDRLLRAEDFIRKNFNRITYKFKTDDLKMIKKLTQNCHFETGYKLAKKRINHNSYELELIFMRRDTFVNSHSIDPEDRKEVVSLHDDFMKFYHYNFNSEPVNNILLINNTIDNTDLFYIVYNIYPDINRFFINEKCVTFSNGDNMDWHSHPIGCPSTPMVPYLFYQDLEVNTIIPPSPQDLSVYIGYTYSDNYVFSSDFIYSIYPRNEVKYLISELKKYPHLITGIIQNPLIKISGLFFPMLGYLVESYFSNQDISYYITLCADILLNRSTFIYKAFIDKCFQMIKPYLSEEKYEVYMLKFKELYEKIIICYFNNNSTPQMLQPVMIEFEQIFTSDDCDLFNRGLYPTHKSDIIRLINNLKTLVSSFAGLSQEMLIISASGRNVNSPISIIWYAIFKNLHQLLYIFTISLSDFSDRERTIIHIYEFFKNCQFFMYKSFYEQITLNDLNSIHIFNTEIVKTNPMETLRYETLLNSHKDYPLFTIDSYIYNTDEDLEIKSDNENIITNYKFLVSKNIDGSSNMILFDINLIKYYIFDHLIKKSINITDFSIEYEFNHIDYSKNLIIKSKVTDLLHEINTLMSEIAMNVQGFVSQPRTFIAMSGDTILSYPILENPVSNSIQTYSIFFKVVNDKFHNNIALINNLYHQHLSLP